MLLLILHSCAGFSPFILCLLFLHHHSLFKEVLLWVRGDLALLLSSLPRDVRAEIDSRAVAGLNLSTSLLSAEADKKSPRRERDEDGRLELASFTILLLSSATQGFPDVAPEARVSRFFSFAESSGGDKFIVK